MKYPLASDSWGKEEVSAILRVITSNRFTMGEEVKSFEEEFAAEFGAEHAIMVNSGSSANLVMIAAMVEDGQLKAGDEIIVPAVSWSTTYFPCHQYGLKMVFVDIDRKTLNIDPEKVRLCITPNTRAIFAVNLLGAPCDFKTLLEICDEHGLILLEDNCESLGAKTMHGYTGTIGDAGTFSFFFSHHMQTMEGGMILTDDETIAQYCRVIRAHGWLRDLPDENMVCDKSGNPFEDSFKFAVPGFCVRPLEMSGAVGREQLKKWKEMNTQRQENAHIFRLRFNNKEWCLLQDEHFKVSSWFGFSMVLTGSMENRRDEVVKHLMANGVECRPIVAGNFFNQPVIERMADSVTVPLPLTNADYIDKNGFFLGNNPTDLKEQIFHVDRLFDELLAKG